MPIQHSDCLVRFGGVGRRLTHIIHAHRRLLTSVRNTYCPR